MRCASIEGVTAMRGLSRENGSKLRTLQSPFNIQPAACTLKQILSGEGSSCVTLRITNRQLRITE